MNAAGEGDDLVDLLRTALSVVIDPELGYNVVDLGLVYEIAQPAPGRVRITMTTTTRGCPATDYLKDGVRDAALAVSCVEACDVALTYDPPWTPQMMSAAAKAHLGVTRGW